MPDQVIPQPSKKPMNNPLANYFRQPKLYMKLPSHGNYYPGDALDRSEIDEYAVYAMTAKDELMFKTPDALMNGQATVEVIKSCVPSIKNPWQMPSIDLDAVLVAIRIATYGDSMDITANCPSCNHFNEYALNLVNYLDHLTTFQYQSSITIDPLTINIRPYSYKELNRTSLKTLEQQKIFSIVNDETMPDEEKIEKFSESFVKLTHLTVEVIAGCIESIETPEGTVTDQNLILEFIQNSSSEIFNKLSEHISDMKEQMTLKAQDVECAECKHHWTVEVAMDQTNFFAKGS
jgi:hypothetical protein